MTKRGCQIILSLFLLLILKLTWVKNVAEDSYRNGIGALEFRRSSPDALCGRCGAAWIRHIGTDEGILCSLGTAAHLLPSVAFFPLIYRDDFSWLTSNWPPSLNILKLLTRFVHNLILTLLRNCLHCQRVSLNHLLCQLLVFEWTICTVKSVVTCICYLKQIFLPDLLV